MIRYSVSINAAPVNLNEIPVHFNGWTGENFTIDANTADVLKADQTLMRKYVDGNGNSIWLFIGYFKDQKYGSQIHSPKHCLPGGGWKIRQKEKIQLSNETVNNFELISNFGKSKMIYWFETQSGAISNELMLKVDLVKNALLRKPTNAAFLRFNSDGFGSNLGDEEILEFIKQIYPYIKESLQMTI